jgi:hypothetical protein
VRLTTTRRAWERWQAAAGPWQGWSVCPALLAPGIEDVDVPRRSSRETAALRVATGLGPGLAQGGVLVVLDLEPVFGAQVAAALHQRRLANAVLVLPRWPYAHAVLPVDNLVRALVSLGKQLAPAAERLPNVSFVLDAQRQRPVPRRSASDRRADNRYRLSVSDLPNLAALRAHGIGRVLKLSTA